MLIARRGVTIVELMVVLSIIAVLLGMLLPAVHIVRERARETICKNNLYQTNLAIGTFLETHKELPGPTRPGHIGGWMIDVLPFIEQQNLFNNSQRGTPLANAPESILRPPTIFRCPRSTTLDTVSENAMWRAHYVLIPIAGRKSFQVYDAPVDLDIPWASGAEMDYQAILRTEGPHHGGFFFANGFQLGVGFMLDGENQL